MFSQEDFYENEDNFLLTFVICFLFFSTTLPLHAANILNNVQTYEYIDENGYIHTYFDTFGNPLSIQSVDKMYNPDIESEIVPYGVVYPFTDTVLVNSYSLQMGTTSKMTADVKGPATISYITSKETKSTISVNFSADIKSRIFNSLAFKFGVSYTQTSSTGASFQIPSGKTGAVYLTPRLYTGTCTYVDQNGVGTSVYVTFPKTVNRFTDGVFKLITY